MVRLLKRFFRRVLIFALGVFTVWLIVFVVFKFVDHRLPWILAVAVTYGIAAYIILPRAVRMGLKILQHKRVPSYTITGDGLPGDPVNVVLVGTLQQLRAAFAIIGWREADRLSLESSWRMIRAFLLQLALSDGAVQHALSFRARPGHRFPEGHRRQPAQARSHSILGFGPRGGAVHLGNR